MRSAAELVWLWVCLAPGPGASSASLPETTDRGFIDECVREHNRARTSVSPPASNMLYMTWDKGLSTIAKAWAEHCVFGHNPKLEGGPSLHPAFSSVGENLWTGSPSLFDATAAIKKWVDEKEDYNYEGNNCSSVCGHYTQVVWGSSYKVGCAAHLCPGGVAGFTSKEGVVFVCNYATAGNVNSERPYKSGGGACAGCSGSCEDRLCRHGPSADGDPAPPAPAAADSEYARILIARPVCLVLTFAAAYAVRYFYPDIFCYE